MRAVCVCFILLVQQPSQLASFIHSFIHCFYSFIFYIVSRRGMPLALVVLRVAMTTEAADL